MASVAFGAFAVASCALLSACTPAASQPSAPPASPASTQAAGTAPATVAPAGGSTSVSPTPGAAAGGSLRVAADVDLGAQSSQAQVVAAEAPDGTVFYAAGQVVMVVDGAGAPQPAEHPGAKVLGLGASSSTLYVVTPQALIAYSRSTGNQAGRWALTGSPGTPTTAGVTAGDNGDVWVWTDWATDFSGYEFAMVYAVTPGAAKPSVLSKTAQPGSLVTDGSDAFFVASPSASGTGEDLMEASAGPSAAIRLVTVSPVSGSFPLAGFSGSQVVLYAQDSLSTFTPGSAAPVSVRADAGQPVTLAGTSSGLLFLTCSKQACSTVTQVDQSSGKAGSSVRVPASGQILLGPDPVVLGTRSGHLRLVRLS